MKILTITFFITALLSLLVTGSYAFADAKHYDHNSTPTTTTSTPLNLPSESTYGLLGLAANNQFDWGVPDKVQVGVTMAFTEGGNQAVSIGAATRLGGILIHGNFITTVSAPDNADDYVVVIGGTMRF